VTEGRTMAQQPIRGTQKLVDQMGWVFMRPQLTGLEIAWRWVFGVPFLLICWREFQQILTVLPPDSAGLNGIDTQNPWVAVLQLGNVWARYQPHVAGVFPWLAPAAALAWVVVSGVGRGIVYKRLEPGVRFRPLATLLLQAVWLALIAVIFWGWFLSIQWVAATHISPDGEADLVGYSIWAIFLSLGFFSLWALVSWPVSIAPILVVLEDRSPASALVESFRLGKVFTGKLMEINLVMGIVTIMLLVLAMVFSAAPLPFSDQLGPAALHVVAAASAIFYLVASDYFQVVRLKSFVEFWRTYRGKT
jgi:hypothetical protein